MFFVDRNIMLSVFMGFMKIFIVMKLNKNYTQRVNFLDLWKYLISI